MISESRQHGDRTMSGRKTFLWHVRHVTYENSLKYKTRAVIPAHGTKFRAILLFNIIPMYIQCPPK